MRSLAQNFSDWMNQLSDQSNHLTPVNKKSYTTYIPNLNIKNVARHVYSLSRNSGNVLRMWNDNIRRWTMSSQICCHSIICMWRYDTLVIYIVSYYVFILFSNFLLLPHCPSAYHNGNQGIYYQQHLYCTVCAQQRLYVSLVSIYSLQELKCAVDACDKQARWMALRVQRQQHFCLRNPLHPCANWQLTI